VGAKIKFNIGNINHLTENAKTALHQTADATLTDILQAQVIPFDVGTMQNDQTFVDSSELDTGHVYIVTSAPQATRLYYHPEYNFQTVNNPNAGAGWFEDWIKGGKSKWVKNVFAQLYRKLNGGIS
jgi:hypothetical protein